MKITIIACLFAKWNMYVQARQGFFIAIYSKNC